VALIQEAPQPLRYWSYVYDAWYDGAGLRANNQYVSQGDRPLPWYWLGARAYDPTLERFLQPDPSALDGARSYAYCHDAPADCADPSGLVSQNTGPEPDPGAPIGPGLGAPGGAAEGAGLPVAGAGDSATTSLYNQLAYDPGRLLPAPEEPAVLLPPPHPKSHTTLFGDFSNEDAAPIVQPSTVDTSDMQPREIGNLAHYDRLNGGSGSFLPTQLQNRYRYTRFRFAYRGAKGPDVEYMSGPHPSRYPGSAFPSDARFADFKPDPGAFEAVADEIAQGKLPEGTVTLPYDPVTLQLLQEKAAEEGK